MPGAIKNVAVKVELLIPFPSIISSSSGGRYGERGTAIDCDRSNEDAEWTSCWKDWQGKEKEGEGGDRMMSVITGEECHCQGRSDCR